MSSEDDNGSAKITAKWIGVNPNIIANSEIQSKYVKNGPPANKPWTDNSSPITSLEEKNRRDKDRSATSAVQSESGVSVR